MKLGIGLLALGILAAAGLATAAGPTRIETHPLGAREAEPILETLKPLLKPESKLSLADGALVVLADSQDHEVVKQVLARLDAARKQRSQYVITIVQGASRAEAERLMEAGGATYSTRPSRSGAQTSSLRVVSGERAFVESGRIVQAVDAVFLGRGGYRRGGFFGATRSERRVSRGFEVTATRRDELLELEIAPFTVRREREQADERQRSASATRLLVPLGRWTEVASGVARSPAEARTYGSRASASESAVLLRADPVAP